MPRTSLLHLRAFRCANGTEWSSEVEEAIRAAANYATRKPDARFYADSPEPEIYVTSCVSPVFPRSEEHITLAWLGVAAGSQRCGLGREAFFDSLEMASTVWPGSLCMWHTHNENASIIRWSLEAGAERIAPMHDVPEGYVSYAVRMPMVPPAIGS